jgi:predicted transposase YdaD
MVLMILPEDQAPSEARYLLARSRQEGIDSEASAFIMEMVSTIISYKFVSLSREEVEAMLDITFEETRVYRDLKEDIQAEVTEEVKTEEAVKLLLRMLPRQLKQELSEEMRSQITALPLPLLEDLSEALLDFEQLNDLQTWLQQHERQ